MCFDYFPLSNPHVLYSRLQWFADVNYVCKELKVGKEDRSSVPQHLDTKDKIRNFLLELNRGFEEWRAMKLVVLGHGDIGKTTLIHTIKNLLVSSNKVTFVNDINRRLTMFYRD